MISICSYSNGVKFPVVIFWALPIHAASDYTSATMIFLVILFRCLSWM